MPIYRLGESLTPETGVNECNVLTIFPMGLECITTLPTNLTSVDGQIFLKITGGTPPYNVSWNNNNTQPLLVNLPYGSYTATVIDSFGDYTASTTCVLGIPSPTPTSTPLVTPTPSSIYFNFCITLIQGSTYIRKHFNPYGVQNNKPRWISNDSSSVVYWNSSINKWEYKLLSYSGTPFIINSNPSVPPLSNWQYVGQPLTQVSANLGLCTSGTPLTMSVQVNNPIYGNDGSIVITPIGGSSPYQYSLNNGLTYQNGPIFTALNGGVYNLRITDVSGATFTTSATLITPPPPTLYTVNLNTSSQIISETPTTLIKTYTTNISVSPQLPSGATITMNLQHLNSFSGSPTSGITYATSVSSLYKNAVPNSPTTSTINTILPNSNPLPNCATTTVYRTNKSENWSSITITKDDTMYIYTITTVYKPVNQPSCFIGAAADTYSKNNLTISGCSNCVVQ